MFKFKSTNLPKKKILIEAVIAVVAIMVAIVAVLLSKNEKVGKAERVIDPELARAMTYDQFEDADDDIEGTDNVKFSAFFLRDVDNDGNAEKIKGTCKEIGKEDTLYMEINVQTEGVLKNGKIEVDGKNFYLKTVAPKDEQLKENYISDNTKIIEFNDITSGTQKLLSGDIRSGNYYSLSGKADAIGSNINNLSRDDNKIIFTGTYVNADGNETEIKKEINLTTDWYGTTKASLYTSNYSDESLEKCKDTVNNIVTFELPFVANETNQQLKIMENYVEGVVPQINGYDPLSVTCSDSVDLFNYDEESRKFVIKRNGTVDEERGEIDKSIGNSNAYTIKIKYPMEIINDDELSTSVSMDVMTYYVGYNNQNNEFRNPYKSNEEKKTLTWNFYHGEKGDKFSIGLIVGKYVSYPKTRYVISKKSPMRIYNGLSEEEKDDTYTVSWLLRSGTSTSGFVASSRDEKKNRTSDVFVTESNEEISMEQYVDTVGLCFSRASYFVADDGWLKVYDDESDELLVEFNKDDLEKYTSGNFYMFKKPVKHIRIESSDINKNSDMTITLKKELDDSRITSDFTKDEFARFEFIKSFLNVTFDDGDFVYTMKDAVYEDQYSIADLSVKKVTLSTQVTEKNDILKISVSADESLNQIAWGGGSFLIKMPDNIISTEINSVNVNNRNIDIVSYEYVENDNGRFIKINTQNLGNNLQVFDIILDVDLTPDPRIVSKTEYFELYAYNEAASSYYYGSKDIYDVNDNLNVEEQVHRSTVNIYMVSPNSLLTNQTISDFDESGDIVISPNVADVKSNMTSTGKNQEEKTVKIGAQLINNYPNNLSEVKILGKIPFEGNTYVLSEGSLNSQFTTKMENTGIEVPEALQGKIDVYYSENENPDKELDKSENGWKLAEDVENWDNVKTYLIDFKDQIIKIKDDYTFYYKVRIPNNVGYNKIAFSHHGVWFTLNTPEGKYKTKTEPNKVGLRIAKKYNFELQKYHSNRDVLVPGATYMVTKEATDIEKAQMKTAVTNNEGKLELQNLYAEAVYTVQEIKSPENYELNDDIITFIAHVKEDGSLEIEKLEGNTKGDILVETQEAEDGEVSNKVIVKVEDETKSKLKITKYEAGSTTTIRGVKYKLTNEDSSIEKYLTTNGNGEINLNGLSVGVTYTLEEIGVEGYYLNAPVSFILKSEGDAYVLDVTSGDVKEANVVYENSMPVIDLSLEDEKIPTYILEITKIKKMAEVSDGDQQEETVLLSGAKFKLYKGSKEIGSYETDENGKITIDGLYQYVSGHDEEDVEYTLKEIYAPSGYSKVKDIVFKVDSSDGELKFVTLSEKEQKYTIDGNVVKLTIEDVPSFKIIKKDAETGERLAGIKFAIYNVDEGMVPARNGKNELIGTKEIINGKQYYTVATNEQGEVVVDLPEGSYKAVEVQAPDKYDISDSSFYFGIGGSREGKVGYRVTDAQKVGTYIHSLDYTDDGGYVVAGSFDLHNMDLGNGVVLETAGVLDGMLVKYNSNNECEWARTIAGTNSESIETVSQTSDGGYIAGGHFYSSSIDLGNGITVSGNYSDSDGIIIKYNHSGDIEWYQTILGANSGLIVSQIVEDAEENYIIVGSTSASTVKVGNDVILDNPNPSTYRGVVIKISASGETKWTKVISGSKDDYINSVAVLPDGGYVVGGEFRSTTIDLGNNVSINNVNYRDGMLIKYNKDGECQWAKVMGGSSNEYVTSVDVTTNGNILVAGNFDSFNLYLENSIEISSHRYSDYRYDGFVIKYNTDGNIIFAKAVGGNSDDYINEIRATEDEGYAIVGSFYGNVKIDDEYLINRSTKLGANDGFLIKFNKNEKCEYLKGIGGDTYDDIGTLAVRENDDLLIGGGFNSSFIHLGNNKNVSNTGNSRISLVIEIKKGEISNPMVSSIQETASNLDDDINSVEKTPDGGYVVAGRFGSEEKDLGNGLKFPEDTNGRYRGAIIKYDAGSNCEWVAAMSSASSSELTKVITTKDGGYLAIGQYRYSRMV